MTAPADGPAALPRRQPEEPLPPHPLPNPSLPLGQAAPATGLHNTVAGSGDNCPNCGATLAADQRYCLNCGQRRGDPRLPFMDAVTFMESSKQPVAQAQSTAPPPPPDRRPFMSANASLVAGVATLILAIGVGVLIGRSGDSGSSNAASQTPQIIRVGGSGGGEAGTSAAKGTSKSSANAGSGGGKTNSATKKKAAKKLETGKSGATKATEEAYEPAPGVKIAPPEQKLGGECDPSVAGCGKNGKFEGTFFE
ncbi:MAG: hypothetical protein ACTHN3_05885 [Solirubrobacterales bacterium]